MFQYETKVDQGMSLVNWELIICQIGVWKSHNSYCLWVVEHREVWLGTLTESVSVNGACLQSVVSLLKCGSTTFSRKWGGYTWCWCYVCTNVCKSSMLSKLKMFSCKPVHLQVQHWTVSTIPLVFNGPYQLQLILSSWSCSLDARDENKGHRVQGYVVYVSGHPRGKVEGALTSHAEIQGLEREKEYKIQVGWVCVCVCVCTHACLRVWWGITTVSQNGLPNSYLLTYLSVLLGSCATCPSHHPSHTGLLWCS